MCWRRNASNCWRRSSLREASDQKINNNHLTILVRDQLVDKDIQTGLVVDEKRGLNKFVSAGSKRSRAVGFGQQYSQSFFRSLV